MQMAWEATMAADQKTIHAAFWEQEVGDRRRDPFVWNGDVHRVAQLVRHYFELGWRAAEKHAADGVAWSRDPDLTPEQEAFCDLHCCWSGHHKDCPRGGDGVKGTDHA
jgi:hypothetical protein